MTRIPCAAIALAVLSFAPAAAAQTNSWFGTWKLKDASAKPETLIYRDAGGGAMRMESVEDKSVLVTHFDGKPAMDEGSGRARHHALALKAISGTSYSWTFLVAGKPVARGVNTLAVNRKSFTEVSWPVAKPAKKFTLVYERQ